MCDGGTLPERANTHTHAAFNMMVYSEEPIWPIPHIPALYDDGDYGGKIMWGKLGCNALYLFFFSYLETKYSIRPAAQLWESIICIRLGLC